MIQMQLSVEGSFSPRILITLQNGNQESISITKEIWSDPIKLKSYMNDVKKEYNIQYRIKKLNRILK